jgi:hypothetical protein
MKDSLQDLIQHTHGLGCVDLIKIVGTDKTTQVSAIGEGNSVIINGKFKTPEPQFVGTFGMPNLEKLKIIVGFDDYDDTSKISMVHETRDGEKTPACIHFETQNGDFVNDYRLMGKALVESQVANFALKVAPKWEIEFEPNMASIARLKKQASANSEEIQFTTSTDKNGDLRIAFGDPSAHSGNFVFESKVTGKLTNPLKWPVKSFLAILDLPGDKKLRISNQGLAEITVDSGLASYSYMFPCHTK